MSKWLLPAASYAGQPAVSGVMLVAVRCQSERIKDEGKPAGCPGCWMILWVWMFGLAVWWLGGRKHHPDCALMDFHPHYQVPQDEWSGFSPLGKEEDIPCRRMRSGSYVKAMADDDSGDSDGSPKPSPKMQARRASYLKATQPSLTEMTTLQ